MSISYADKSLGELRSLIVVLDRELAATPSSAAALAAWTSMVKILALGAAPAERTCPTCQEVGMRAASRCSRCWSTLAPLGDEEVEA